MLYQLRLTYGLEYILILALATFGTDTGAYFTGMCFGKHKLNPRLSPKKTIEGSIGGIFFRNCSFCWIRCIYSNRYAHNLVDYYVFHINNDKSNW